MEYCRSLKFEQDPDYKFMTGLFEKCLQRHNLDPKAQDYTWKQNRLSKDKEALKNSVLNVINKNKKADDTKVIYSTYLIRSQEHQEQELNPKQLQSNLKIKQGRNKMRHKVMEQRRRR